ncbi:MAG: SusD/RagB family nutrient-binding outer membrane lipoprotein [Spirosomataceae bacterium]
MKRINLLKAVNICIIGSLVFLYSCTKDFPEINTDRNTVATVGSAELPFLFSKAEASAVPNIWNYQVAQNLFADQYAQYFACTATYFPSDRLNIRMDWVGAAFNPIYSDMVPQLLSIKNAAAAGSAEAAIADVVWVLGFHRVTDYWGPIPYFNAGTPGNSVAYDPQDKIYDDFFKKLTAAANVLKTKTSEKPYGSYDLIYGGDVSKWLKFTNSLRLRLALRISKLTPQGQKLKQRQQ